jgi:hypothetical protein
LKLLKLTILAVFIASSAACLLLSAKKNSLPVHHAQTVRKANPQNVKGDFERENRFENALMRRQGNDFFISFDNQKTYKIEAVVGDEKLEEYLADDGEKLVRLPIAFDLRAKRWINLNSTVFEIDGADFYKYQTDWETNCAACHLENPPPTNDCAACHSKNPHEFEADTIKFSAREHQGILRSDCFIKNKGGNVIGCQSCHTAENPRIVSEQSCTNCHQQFSETKAAREHSKHQTANCFSCHQPEIAYGHLEFQRTHEIGIPNPARTATENIPNACNLCHSDKSVNWAISESKKLWSTRFRDAQISTDKQFNQPEAVRALFAGNAYERALAADALGKHSNTEWFAPFALEVFADENYPLVRYFLADALKNEFALDYLAPKAERIGILERQYEINQIQINKLRRKRKFPDILIGD